MENYLRPWDPLVIGTIILPLGLVATAWALRMACAVCSVRVPDFMPAAAVVVVTITVNLALRMFLHYHQLSLGLGSQLLLMLLATSLIVAISVRTSICSALAITIIQAFICGLAYFGMSEVSQAML